MIDVGLEGYLDSVVVPELSTSKTARTRRRQWHDAIRTAASDPRVRGAVEIARHQGLVLTHAQARTAGLSGADVRRLVRRGTWTAPRRNVLCVLPQPSTDDTRPHGRRPEIAATAAALVRPETAISHESASAVHGIAMLNGPVRPILTVATGNGGGQPGALVHLAGLPAGEVRSWFGARVTSPARTVVDVARNSGAGAGLVAADSALREGLVTREQLEVAVAAATHWPGVVVARRVVELASPRAESPLESLSRLLISDGGLPIPELQIVVQTTRGAYRVDGIWRDRRVILEADGMLKYLQEGSLGIEKKRQELLERAGYRVVRVTWDDVLHQPAETLARIAHALRRGGRGVELRSRC